MTAAMLLAELEARGATVTLHEDGGAWRPRCEAAAGVLTDELRAARQDCRASVAAILRLRAAATARTLSGTALVTVDGELTALWRDAERLACARLNLDGTERRPDRLRIMPALRRQLTELEQGEL